MVLSMVGISSVYFPYPTYTILKGSRSTVKMAPAIPKDSLVLVTGVNGYIGSHIADQLLEAGYRVRGTTRSLEKVKGLSALWEQKYGPGKVEFIVISDMSRAGAFDEAVKGNCKHSPIVDLC